LISRRRHCFSLSFPRLRPPGNIHNLSPLRLTRSTRPRFVATSFEDLSIQLSPFCQARISRQSEGLLSWLSPLRHRHSYRLTVTARAQRRDLTLISVTKDGRADKANNKKPVSGPRIGSRAAPTLRCWRQGSGSLFA
jgi:hypothetical protein